MVTNGQEVVRQQHLREILGKKEGRKMSFGDIMNCLWVSIVVFSLLLYSYDFVSDTKENHYEQEKTKE